MVRYLQEKRRKKNFMMMRHNRDVRGKTKRSFRDKQVSAWNSWPRDGVVVRALASHRRGSGSILVNRISSTGFAREK